MMSRVISFKWGVVLACLFGLLGGCASDKPKPASLTPLINAVQPQSVWQFREGAPRFVGWPAHRDGVMVVADNKSQLQAISVSTGQRLWQVALGAPIEAGAGFDGRRAAAVIRGNVLVVVQDGKVAWRYTLPARTVTPPVVAGDRVFVMTVNRVVHAFDGADGSKLWTYDKPGDALTLAQPGVLSTWSNTLLVGQGPQLVGLDPNTGLGRWEVALANPRGSNEVERLADLVGPSARWGDMICARAYQAAVSCVDARRGQLRWTRNTGGWNSLAVDAQRVVGADASSRISAWSAVSGEILWSQEALVHRELSAPVLWGPYVAFGDLEGRVHLLQAESGNVVARLTTDGSPVQSPPQVFGATLVVTTRSGGIFAFKLN